MNRLQIATYSNFGSSKIDGYALLLYRRRDLETISAEQNEILNEIWEAKLTRKQDKDPLDGYFLLYRNKYNKFKSDFTIDPDYEEEFMLDIHEREMQQKMQERAEEIALRCQLANEELRRLIDEYKAQKAYERAQEKAKKALEIAQKEYEAKMKRRLPKKYAPKPDSWMEKTLDYLQEMGESRAIEIRARIGLDEHCAHTPYPDRSNFTLLSNIIPRLMRKGLVERTGRGFYKLTRPWIKPWEELKVNGEKVIPITYLENVRTVKNPVYGALVSKKGLLCFLRWKNNSFTLESNPDVWESYYGEKELIRLALKYELSYKYVK